MCFLWAPRISKTQTAVFKISPDPTMRATLWLEYRLSLWYLLMQVHNFYVLFMCFKNIRDQNRYSENFTRISPLQATLWFVYRLSSRYLWMQLRKLYVLQEYYRPKLLFCQFTQIIPLKSLSYSSTARSCDIIRFKCTIFMWFHVLQ